MRILIYIFALLLANTSIFSQTEKVDATIAKIMKEHKIVGLQLAIVKNNTIVKTGNYGLASIEDAIPVDGKTVFSINSISKSFTSLAIMQLVEKGKLKLEEPITKYLDSLPTRWENISLNQIVSHKSGLPEIWNAEGNLLSEDSQILFQKIKESPLAFPAGTRVRENPANYILLGMLIEKVSGQAFEEYIAENIFTKAKMTLTIKAGMGGFNSIKKHSARPYSYFGGANLSNVYQPMPTNLYPAGGIFSTATELAQWVIALQNNQFINSENHKTLLKPITLDNGERYQEEGIFKYRSIGFSLSAESNQPIIGLRGGARNAVLLYPKSNLSIIVLTNLMGSHPEDFIEEIANLYIKN